LIGDRKILKDADKEKEAKQQRTQQEFLSSKAYKLFSEGKSLVQAAIDLNIRASEAIISQREYWDPEGLHDPNQIYEEIKGDTWHLLDLYRSVEVAEMGVPHVLTLLKVANNDLPTLEYRYEMLKQEVNSLQAQKRNLSNQVTEEGSNAEYYRAACQREIAKFESLQNRRMKEEALARHFRSNNSEYVKIDEKVRETLSNRKALLKLAVLCLTESVKENPEKYSFLVQQNTSSKIDYTIPYFNPFYMHGQPYIQQHIQSKVYFIE
jgi:hypothetical protein